MDHFLLSNRSGPAMGGQADWKGLAPDTLLAILSQIISLVFMSLAFQLRHLPCLFGFK